MNLVIYGSVPSGSVTVNGDTRRCVLRKQADGSWKASRPEHLKAIQETARAELAEILELLTAEPAQAEAD